MYYKSMLSPKKSSIVHLVHMVFLIIFNYRGLKAMNKVWNEENKNI